MSNSIPQAMSETQLGTEPRLAKSQGYMHPSSRVTGDKSILNFSVHAHSQDFHFPPPLWQRYHQPHLPGVQKPAPKSCHLRKGSKLADVHVQKAVCFHKPMRFWAQMAACTKMTGSWSKAILEDVSLSAMISGSKGLESTHLWPQMETRSSADKHSTKRHLRTGAVLMTSFSFMCYFVIWKDWKQGQTENDLLQKSCLITCTDSWREKQQ